MFYQSHHLILITEKEDSQSEALSWLQWIAKRSKLKTTTSPPPPPPPTTTTTTPPPPTTRPSSRPKTRTTTIKLAIIRKPTDPFLELLSPSNLDFPGPPLGSPTTSQSSTEMIQDDEDEESKDVTTTQNVIDYQEKMKEDQNDDELTGSGPKDDDLRAKYIKLVDHNSKLVDLLRTTMEIQTDLFRKLIHYIFP